MMKRILIPTDFSEEAGYAYDFGFEMAQKTNSSLTMINVVEYPTGSSFNSMGVKSDHDPMENLYIMKLVEATKKRMEELISEKDFSGITADYKISLGSPYHQIEDEMKENPANLIIMGSRGASGSKETILGSNAEKVIRNSGVPVIILHGAASIDSIKNIVFASDFENEDQELVNYLTELQEFFGATLHILKVNTPAYFAPTRYDQKIMNSFVNKYDLSNTTINIYNDEDEETGIRNFADDINADMIALATHGRKGLGRFLLGSVAEDVANRSNKPVWTYRLR